MFEPCECGGGQSYIACCGRLHSGTPAVSAEELMRSRYTAFARGIETYLLTSWAPETRPISLDLDRTQEWIGLTIERHEMTSADTAVVRFTAVWRNGAHSGQMTETSRFRRDGAGWVYVDGASR